MKILTSTILLFVTVQSQSALLEVIGPCSEKPILSIQVSTNQSETVGQFSIRALSLSGIKFIGTDRGIKSIDNTPTGDDAIEVISNEEMRAYGWCYKINGLEPNVYPHEESMKSNQDKILWTYGFSLYQKGQWITMCDPAWKIQPRFLCKK